MTFRRNRGVREYHRVRIAGLLKGSIQPPAEKVVLECSIRPSA